MRTVAGEIHAGDEQVKAAYKELVKKYHPDKYQGNPLGDLAEEKLRDVNDAYEQIMNERRGGGFGSTAGFRGARAPEFNEIRKTIDANNLKKAQDILDGIPDKNTAEW